MSTRAGAQDLLRSCTHSTIAYQDAPTARRSLARMGRSLVGQYGQEGRARAYITARTAEVGRRLVCTFRGTASTMDLLGAVDARPSQTHLLLGRGRGATVHRGFYEQFMSLEPEISRDIAALARTHGCCEVRFTGHSMGGGMAAIAAAHYAVQPLLATTISCHAFGTPDFADAAFLELLGEDHVAVTLLGDIVPLLPAHPTFRSMPHTLQLTLEGVASCMLPKGTRRRLASPVALACALTSGASLGGMVQGHSCNAYMRALLKMTAIAAAAT